MGGDDRWAFLREPAGDAIQSLCQQGAEVRLLWVKVLRHPIGALWEVDHLGHILWVGSLNEDDDSRPGRGLGFGQRREQLLHRFVQGPLAQVLAGHAGGRGFCHCNLAGARLVLAESREVFLGAVDGGRVVRAGAGHVVRICTCRRARALRRVFSVRVVLT